RRKSGSRIVVTNARPPIHQTTPSTCKLIAMAMIYPVETRLLANGDTVHPPAGGHIDAGQTWLWRAVDTQTSSAWPEIVVGWIRGNRLLYAGELKPARTRMPASADKHKHGIAIAAGGTLILSFDAVLVR